ncbi:hypothetical protein [Streptomyces sp. NPDC002537]
MAPARVGTAAGFPDTVKGAALCALVALTAHGLLAPAACPVKVSGEESRSRTGRTLSAKIRPAMLPKCE